MPKGFTYKWPVTKNATDSEAWAKNIIENFKDLQVFLNGYVVTKDLDGTTVTLNDLNVAGDVVVTGAYAHSGGPEMSHMYRDAVQAISATTWTKVAVNAVSGSSGTIFTEQIATNDVDFSAPGAFLVVGQVECDTTESGYVRVMHDGVEVSRGSFNTRTGGQVTALVRAPAAGTFHLEVFLDTEGNLTAGSNATFLRVARLHGIV